MLRLTIAVFTLLLVTAGTNLFAIDKLYIDDKGFRHYTCGANMRGAQIAIKDIGRNRFRVKSSVYGGILTLDPDEMESKWCTGLLGAVRVLCGYCEKPTTEGRVEDRRKQLGLHSAE